jgi:kexin
MINEHNGTFVDWHLKLWGESIDASKATLLPMPDEHDDDNHAEIATTTIAGTTTAVPTAPVTSLMGNPTDHPDRPVNAKPTGTEDQTKPSTTSTTPPATSSASSWLPSFFPTFNVSPKTQIWIYGAASLILVFCVGLGVYLFMARRKRLRNNPRDEWEFDLLEEDEVEGLNGQGKAMGGRKGGKRRAGELYDAFAAGSDESDNEGEYLDEGGEAEKRLYDDETEDEHHVVGEDEDDVDSPLEEKKPLRK